MLHIYDGALFKTLIESRSNQRFADSFSRLHTVSSVARMPRNASTERNPNLECGERRCSFGVSAHRVTSNRLSVPILCPAAAKITVSVASFNGPNERLENIWGEEGFGVALPV